MSSLHAGEAVASISGTRFEKAILKVAPKKPKNPNKKCKLIITDADGTLYGPDTTVVLNETHGSCGPDGVRLYKQWRQQHAEGILSIGEHLGLEFADIFRGRTIEEIEEIIDSLHWTIKPLPGLHEYLRCLEEQKVKTIVVTNGAKKIAQALLDDHEIPIHGVIGNQIKPRKKKLGVKFKTLSGPTGLDKGGVLEWFLDHSYHILAAIGDSGGDIGLAMAAGKNRIPVFAVADSSLAAWCSKHSHQLRAGWSAFSNFMQLPPLMQMAEEAA